MKRNNNKFHNNTLNKDKLHKPNIILQKITKENNKLINYDNNTIDNYNNLNMKLKHNNIDNNLNLGKNQIESLNNKILCQQNEIDYLKSSLQNYNKTMKEFIKLNMQVKNLEQELKNKNNIISEFQQLSLLTKNKFEMYLNKNNIQRQEYEKKLENYNNIQIENNNLKQKIFILENQNKELQKKIKEIEFKNKTELDLIQNDIISIKKEYENILKQNNDIIKDNNIKTKENEELKNKLKSYEKYKNELDNIKNKYLLIENKMNYKDKNIKELKSLNETLEQKLYSTNDNYNKILNEKKGLQDKLRTIENLNNHYKINFKDKEYEIPEPIRLNKSTISKKMIRRGKRAYYSHNNNRNILGNIGINEFNNNDYMDYNEKFLFNNKVKRRISNTNTKVNYSNYLKNNNTLPAQKYEKSFDYSNFLLDNLKTKISNINFH